MSPETYLQVISILIALAAIAVPGLIVMVGFVYIRQFTEKIDNLSNEVNQLWDSFNELKGNTKNQ